MAAYIKKRHTLPKNVRLQVLYLIRDYDRMQEEADALLHESASGGDGMPKGKTISDTVASKAMKREELLRKIGAIDKALLSVPEEYRTAIFENVKHLKPLPQVADRATYWRHRSKFFYKIAENLKMI